MLEALSIRAVGHSRYGPLLPEGAPVSGWPFKGSGNGAGKGNHEGGSGGRRSHTRGVVASCVATA